MRTDVSKPTVCRIESSGLSLSAVRLMDHVLYAVSSRNGKFCTSSRFQLNLLRQWPLSVKRSFDGLAGHLSDNLLLDGFSDIMIDGQ
jgi:hypothetical protein